MSGVLVRMNQIISELPASEQKVARHVRENLNSVVGISVEELAARSGSSQAAVVRFCKKLGCKGYREFSIQLVSEVAVSQRGEPSRERITDIQAGDRADNVISTVCHHNILAIEDSLSLLNPDDVELAAEKLYTARKIDLYAIGASNLVAQDAQQKLMRINKQVSAYGDPHLQLASAAILTPQDVVVALSWSGETREVLQASKLAKQNGAFIIAVTRLGRVSLKSCADLHFGLSAPEMSIRSGAMSSRIVQMTMIDVLFSCMVSRHYEEVAPCLELTRQVIRAAR